MAENERESTDELMAFHLATGKTNRAVAKLCDVSESTIYRRLRESDFQKMIAKARSSMIEKTAGRLAHYTITAANTLFKLLKHKNAMIRLSAARTILLLGGTYHEAGQTEGRLLDLEEVLNEQKSRPTQKS
jgi:hypothetical protein